MASRKLSRELRSTKWAPPTGWTSPMAFISVCAVARPTPKSCSMSSRPHVSVRAWAARSRMECRVAGPFDGSSHQETSTFWHFQDTGIIGTPAENPLVCTLDITYDNVSCRCKYLC